MNVNKYKNLWRVYREEANPDGEQGGGAGGETPPEGDANAVAEAIGEETPPDNERPEWLLDKYMSDDKPIDEAIKDQAKSYKEIQSKFGAFTGSPEEFEIAVSDELKEAGFELDSESEMLNDAKEFAKSLNMNQEGFNKMIELWATNELAEVRAAEEAKKAAFESLDNGQTRVNNISAWANKSLPPELVGELDSVLQTPEQVKLVERMISMTRNAPVNPSEAAPSSISADEVNRMQFEKDEHGNRKINTDPEFRKRYLKARDEVYGTEEHRQQYG